MMLDGSMCSWSGAETISMGAETEGMDMSIVVRGSAEVISVGKRGMVGDMCGR